MLSRIAIAAAMLSAGVLFAEEKIDLTNVEAWGKSFAQKAKVVDGTLVVAKPHMMTTAKRYDVDPAKSYEISLQVKSGNNEKVWVLAGFACYDKTGRFIASVNTAVMAGTDTVLVEDAKKDSNVLTVKDASKWSKLAHLSVAINTKPDYSDLPNYNIAAGNVTKVEKTGDNWTVTLAKPLKIDIPAGTALRQMANGGFLYTAGSQKTADVFVTMKGTAKGISKSGYTNNVFPAGTVKISPMILNNWGGVKADTIYKDITFVIK